MDNKNIIYVLDRLLQIAIDGEAINKSRKIDLGLYKILNSSKINQEIIHIGVLPIFEKKKEVSDEFIHFINNLWMYMEYDINTDFLWGMTMGVDLMPDKEKQKNIYEKIVSIRMKILQYLLDKKVISNEDFLIEASYKIKGLMG